MNSFLDSLRLPRRWQLCILSVMSLTIVVVLFRMNNHLLSSTPEPLQHFDFGGHDQASASALTKPEGLKVIGLVFFGRRDRVQILHCYLERNLAINGGWLDEVHWVVNTDTEPDLAYLRELLARTPSYKQMEIEEHGFVGYGLAWSMLESDAIYVKIDDDVVYMADDTIARVVSTKVTHPEYLVVSANIINSPLMGWVHYRMGAVHPYLPEYISPEDVSPSKAYKEDEILPPADRTSWQYTQYPLWRGPHDYYFSFQENPPQIPHRWLRIDPRHASAALRHTPMADSEYGSWGNSLSSWAIAAQQHYSLLENILDGQLGLYQLSTEASPWVTDYQRLSINLIAINSTEILSHLPMDTVDEEWLTVSLPKKIGKSVVVDTHALASHFTFGTQGKVATTDLLGRYLDYALENVCMASNK